MNNKIPIFYASNDNYAKPLAVSMASVLANTDEYIEFYILENNISSKSKEKIIKLKNHFKNFSIKYIPINMEIFKNFPDLNWYSLNMYSRFFIPELETTIDKAIYLDVDIILKSNIKNLFETDLEDFAIGAVVGEKKYLNDKSFIQHMNSLGLDKTHTYFGSGVLLINSKLWRKNHIFEKLVNIVENNKDKLKYPDQDALNIIFNNNNYKHLDLYWNRDINCLEEDIKFKKDELKKCFLIHYDGPNKPWNSNIFASDLFWNYAEYTAFKKELIIHKKKLMKKFYNEVNLAVLYKILYKISFSFFRKYFKKKYQRANEIKLLYKI